MNIRANHEKEKVKVVLDFQFYHHYHYHYHYLFSKKNRGGGNNGRGRRNATGSILDAIIFGSMGLVDLEEVVVLEVDLAEVSVEVELVVVGKL